jgi:hypothetical protein
MDTTRISSLNALFPQAGYDGKVHIAPGTQNQRVLHGVELQVMLTRGERPVPHLLGIQSLDRAAASAAAHRDGSLIIPQFCDLYQCDTW